MVLLFNVFITNKSATGGQWESLGVGYDRGNLKTYNKLDILKYSLASYAVANPWKRVILNLELDPDYISLDKKQELMKIVGINIKKHETNFKLIGIGLDADKVTAGYLFLKIYKKL